MQPTTIQFSHSNGFSAQTYRYFFEQLAPYRVEAVNRFGHGEYRVGQDWHPLADELLADIRRHGNTPVVGVGHSLGGVLTLWAAVRHPELFSKVILIDPPIFGLQKRIPIWIASLFGLAGKVVPPARKAKRRRRYFSSKQEATETLRGRSLFRNFHPECFQDYIEHGLVAQGNGVGLAFSAEIEYDIFCKTPCFIGDTVLPMPSYFVYSAHKEVLQDADLAWLKKNFTRTKLIEFDGGHMFPMEQPAEAAQLIRSLIEEKI